MPDALRTHLATQLEATVARRSHDEILYSVPPAARGIQPDRLPEGYLLWQILEHMRICQADCFRFCTDSDYTVPMWPDDYWPDAVAPPSDDAWNHSLNAFQQDLRLIKELVNDAPVDSAGEIPHAAAVREQEGDTSYHGLTYADEIVAIADHNAYHLGQFGMVRRLLGVWPPAPTEPPAWAA
ncbi:ABC transporter [Salinibacter altiplanensis]|uniref:ABC transporter n=1 Tax=Salinibacter altiplanensis TaxID=1803181 RepID=UPI000C9ECEEF|nr:ABC transporter [Salinibacter altiplanensis]